MNLYLWPVGVSRVRRPLNCHGRTTRSIFDATPDFGDSFWNGRETKMSFTVDTFCERNDGIRSNSISSESSVNRRGRRKNRKT